MKTRQVFILWLLSVLMLGLACSRQPSVPPPRSVCDALYTLATQEISSDVRIRSMETLLSCRDTYPQGGHDLIKAHNEFMKCVADGNKENERLSAQEHQHLLSEANAPCEASAGKETR